MSGGVYGGGELAWGFRLPSLSRPRLQPCTPNSRDLSSGHPKACHLGTGMGPALGLGPTPLLPLVLPGQSLVRTGLTLSTIQLTSSRPSRPLLSRRGEWPE